MFIEEIDESYIVTQEGTSEGTQIKYKKDGFWYKLDRDGKEGLSEYLSSRLLTFSDLDSKDYIVYEQGQVNGRGACRSKDYLSTDEEFITLYRLYYNEYGKNLAEVLAGYDQVGDRIKYTLDFVKKSTGLDIKQYLSKVFTLDRIILNEDRHVNNIAIISSEEGFRTAPIFDNGRALLTANRSARWNFGIEDNVKRVIAKPFSGSHQVMYEYFGEGFHLDYKKALEWLESEEDSRERDILIYQIKRYYAI